ncbi:tryptophan halogenase family protein [Microbulbifer hydrolyticus]|uniref:Flavin-dependent dehydrogenase n=1 Tax=Microbulbifer hydrolyticus TaxID=48074 RepID=A0A6P1TFS5_9GAMM|nr:tryptophan halogenase family protein [Microbulbifer hydrolyticus]MBB5211901.1 flavin-dependent dehydrogenase [Microbulbifer hydrolyticus]QHQ40516.1 tryptophan halogenase [Microbulbifer hydrolyticus]
MTEPTDKPIKSVVVVGGGTAGWIVAGRLAALHGGDEGVQVTLVEAPNIPAVGVGEGTWPTMRNTLRKLGIAESEFLRECGATFKQGAKFARWVSGDDDDFYYHPLVLPQGFTKMHLAPYWQRDLKAQGQSFSNAVCYQEQLCERGLAPKQMTTPEFASVANYAYHLDAGKFAQLLERHSTQKLGVRHLRDEVLSVNTLANGDIESLNTRNSGVLAGDLFVDCTGFSSRLLGGHYRVPFIDRSDVLFIDRALAVQVPYEHEDDPIACHTISTAQDAGWIWDIGLTCRRGVGYVYSSNHTSDEAAQQRLRDYLGGANVGPAIEKLSVREIPIHCGHREKFWINNCVAVGLSAGFLEPLEASALVLVELSAEMIAEQLPARRDVMDITARRFNETFRYRWDRIVDFLKLHYLLSRREEEFWRDNRDPATVPDSLSELLALWRHRPPADFDFTSNNEVFPAASYQYVLYGMGFETEIGSLAHTLRDESAAAEHFVSNQKATARALAALPKHRELLEKIHQYGLQAI